MNEFYEKYKREATYTVILVFCLLVVYAAFLLIGRIGKVGVEFHFVPASSSVTINGQTYSSGTQYLPAGTYDITVSHPGFAPEKQTVFVSNTKPKNILAISLDPTSDEAKKWAETHQTDYKNNEKYGAEQARQDGQFFSQTFPIVSKLPYEDPYYKIAYRSTGEQDLTVTITTQSPRYRFAAIQKIRELGFNPTDYKIDFVDYKNPLEVSHE